MMLLGCSNPADKVPGASVGPAASSAKTGRETSNEPGQYFAFGPESAAIEFIGSKVTGSHRGGFRNFAGEFRVVNGLLADSGNKIVIDTASLWADNNRVMGHLKTPDFFDVAKYPTATFMSTSIKQTQNGSTVTGNLSLHGITKEISFPATIQIAPDGVNVTAEFFLNRFDFEIKYPGKPDDLIRKEVVLKLNIKAVPGRAAFASIEQAAQTTIASTQATPGWGGAQRSSANH